MAWTNFNEQEHPPPDHPESTDYTPPADAEHVGRSIVFNVDTPRVPETTDLRRLLEWSLKDISFETSGSPVPSSPPNERVSSEQDLKPTLQKRKGHKATDSYHAYVSSPETLSSSPDSSVPSTSAAQETKQPINQRQPNQQHPGKLPRRLSSFCPVHNPHAIGPQHYNNSCTCTPREFDKLLEQYFVPEWRNAYFNYAKIEKIIKRARKYHQHPSYAVDIELEAGNASTKSHTRPLSRLLPVQSTFRASRRNLASSRSSFITNTIYSTSGASTHGGVRKRPLSYILRFPESLPLEEVVARISDEEGQFFRALDEELTKIIDFYGTCEAQAAERFSSLMQQVQEYNKELRDLKKRTMIQQGMYDKVVARVRGFLGEDVVSEFTEGVPETSKVARHRRMLEPAIFEFYRYVRMLQSYSNVNRTAFSKALKKFERETSVPTSTYMKKVNSSNFVISDKVSELLRKTEDIYAQTYFRGSKTQAIEKLIPNSDAKRTHNSAFSSGMLVGLAIPPIIDGIYRCFQKDFKENLPYWAAILQCYGTIFVPVLFALLFSINIYIWHRNHINYVFIFELDSRTMLNIHQFLEIPSILFVTFCYCFWLSLADFWPSHIAAWVYLYIWIGFSFLLLLFPFPVLNARARLWFIVSVARVFTAGMFKVQFRDFFLGDQLMSLQYSLFNLGYIVCSATKSFNTAAVADHCSTNSTYLSPVLATIPAFLRIGQCFRRWWDSSGNPIHLWNALKYTTNIVYYFLYFTWRVYGSGKDYRLPLFIVAGVIYSLYSWYWDIIMDWNLLKRNGKYRFLRKDLGYQGRVWAYVYYIAIFLDLGFRFTWIAQISTPSTAALKSFIFGLLEIIRRWMWNIFRVESEHCGNMDGYRVTHDVPLPYTLEHTTDTINNKKSPFRFFTQ